MEQERGVVSAGIPSSGRGPWNGSVAATDPSLAALVEGDSASAPITLSVEILRTPPVLGRAIDQMELRVLGQVRDHPDQEVRLGVVYED